MRYFCALVPILGLFYFLHFFPQIFLWRDAALSRWYFFQSRQCGRYLPLQTPRCRAWGLSGERSEVQGWKIATQLLVSINGWFSEVRVDFVDTELLSPTEGDCLDQYLVVRSHGHWSFIKQDAKPSKSDSEKHRPLNFQWIHFYKSDSEKHHPSNFQRIHLVDRVQQTLRDQPWPALLRPPWQRRWFLICCSFVIQNKT